VIVRELRLESRADVDQAVADFIGRLAKQAELPAGKAYWLRLAAEEITTNIIQHGYRGPGPVKLVGGIEADRIWVRIEDRAPAFDPRGHDPTPRLMIEPAEREEGGYGLLLALHKLDDFSYRRTAGQNHNTLVMRREDAGMVLANGTNAAAREGRGDDADQSPRRG
jgi:anti-sigma regulatory factor (Ser/Thr protein kinase)